MYSGGKHMMYYFYYDGMLKSCNIMKRFIIHDVVFFYAINRNLGNKKMVTIKDLNYTNPCYNEQYPYTAYKFYFGLSESLVML